MIKDVYMIGQILFDILLEGGILLPFCKMQKRNTSDWQVFPEQLLKLILISFFYLVVKKYAEKSFTITIHVLSTSYKTYRMKIQILGVEDTYQV